MPRIAVIGNVSRDVVDGGPPRVGGGAFHGARALARLGRPALVVTSCAEDDEADLLPPLQALGVPVDARHARATAGFAFSYDGDERRMEVLALGEPWHPDDVERLADDCAAVHVAPLVRSDFPPPTLAALARGRLLSLDGQGLVRPARTGPLDLDGEFDSAALEHVAVLKLAREEADALVPGGDYDVLAELGVPEVVVTFGSRGALVLADGRAEHVPARRVVTAVDPTGAGDAFSVAYLAARVDGAEPVAAAEAASALVAELLAA